MSTQLEESKKELREQIAEAERELERGNLTFAEKRKLSNWIEFMKDCDGATRQKRQLAEARAEAQESLRQLEAVEFSTTASFEEKRKAKKMAAFVRECLR